MLAAGLRLLGTGGGRSFRDHLVFALHFGAVVGFGTAAETLLLLVLGGTPLAPVAAGVLLFAALVWYVLALRDTYGEDGSTLVRGAGALGLVMTVWLAVAVVLWVLTDFTL